MDETNERLSLGGQSVLARVRANLFDVEIEPVLIGPYQILERIGAGAMGTVFAAYDPELDRRVAVKVLRRDRFDDALAAERHVREGRALARLAHPNVVAVFGAGDSAQGPYIAMELVDGATLATWLRTEVRSWESIVAVFIDAARGLQAAHDAGVIHRDFKPANVLVAADGRVCVADFGLARSFDARAPNPDEPSDGDANATPSRALPPNMQTLGAVGTPVYMSPEQQRCDPLTPASDQYGFCVSLHEALTGELPPEAGASTNLTTLGGTERSPPSGRGASAPRRILALIKRGLEPDTDARWPSMSALADALERALQRPRRLRRWSTVAALTSCSLGFAVWANLRSPEPELEPPPACAGVEADGRALWTAEIEDELAQLATASGLSDQAWAAIDSRLDHRVDAWSTVRRQVCEDRVALRVAAPLTEVRVGCLERSLARVSDVIDLLRAPGGLAAADPLLTTMLDEHGAEPEQCLAPESSLRTTWRHSDEALASQGDEAMREAERLWGAMAAGLDAEAQRLTELLERSLPALEDPAPRGAVARVLAHRTNDPAQRERLLRQAKQDGIRSRNDELMIYACLDLARYQHETGARAAALLELDECEAAIDRLASYAPGHEPLIGLVPVLRGQLHNNRGLTLRELARFGAARGQLERAVELWSGGVSDERLLMAVNNLAQSRTDVGEYRGAVVSFNQAYALAVAVHGESSYELATILMNRGGAYGAMGDTAAARTDLRGSEAMMIELLGRDAPATALLDFNFAAFEIGNGQLEAAQERLAHSRAVWTQTLPENHLFRAALPLLEGVLAREQGQHEAAVARGREAVDALTSALGARHPMAAEATLEWALSALAAEHEPADLSEQIALSAEVISASRGLAGIEAGLLRTVEGELALRQGDLPRARLAFTRAVEILDALGSGQHPKAARARTALARL